MEKFTKLIACLLFASAVIQGCGTQTDQPTRILIAHTYALAMTDSNMFFKYVRENPKLFEKEGKWETAVKRLGDVLVSEGIKSIPSSDIKERANEIAGQAGRPDLGPKVSEGLMESAADLITLGNLLKRMPMIVDGVLRNDATAYNQSLFLLSASAIELSKTVMLQADWAALKRVSYEMNVWIVFQYAQYI